MSRDPRVDAYISARAEFAHPILEHLRAVVHAACPQVEETIKWGIPFFVYKDAPLAHMAAFKAHASFSFWKRDAVLGASAAAEAIGQLGRIEKIADLPAGEQLASMVQIAMEISDRGVKRPRPNPRARGAPELPADFASALAASPAAQTAYGQFSPSAQREYVEWVVEAKRPQTRATRIETAVGWIAEGKKRHWKYERC